MSTLVSALWSQSLVCWQSSPICITYLYLHNFPTTSRYHQLNADSVLMTMPPVTVGCCQLRWRGKRTRCNAVMIGETSPCLYHVSSLWYDGKIPVFGGNNHDPIIYHFFIRAFDTELHFHRQIMIQYLWIMTTGVFELLPISDNSIREFCISFSLLNMSHVIKRHRIFLTKESSFFFNHKNSFYLAWQLIVTRN